MTTLGLAPPSLHSSLQSTRLLCDDSLRAELGRVKQSRERRELVLSNELKRVDHRVVGLKHRLRTVCKQPVASGRKSVDLGELLSQSKAQKEANSAKHASTTANVTALVLSQRPTEDPIVGESCSELELELLKQLLKAKDAELKEMKKDGTKHAALTALHAITIGQSEERGRIGAEQHTAAEEQGKSRCVGPGSVCIV